VSSAISSRWLGPVVKAEERQAVVTDFPEVLPTEIDDESAMRLVRSGDRNALGILFERYYRLVLSVGFRILRSTDEAQELVQEVFLYVHQRPNVYNSSKSKFRSWLVHLAYSRAFNRLEYLKLREHADYEEVQEWAAPSRWRLQFGEDHDTTCLRLTVLGVLPELSGVQRATLGMFFFQGLTLREISQELNETLGNTRHHYYRGLEKLRTRLKDNFRAPVSTDICQA